MLKNFYYLSKPGIVYSNLFTAFAGFVVGMDHFNPWLFLSAMLGITCVLASATSLNNYIDKDIDILMNRTSKRVSVDGSIAKNTILFFSIFMGAIGFSLLLLFVNMLTAIVVFGGFFAYIVLYSLYSKRRNRQSTLIGSISGAVPPLAGYTAAYGQIDAFGFLLFMILLTWQMPHFYAIGIFRLQDYKDAKIPILPVVTSVENTKVHMFAWSIIFLLVAIAPYFYGYVGRLYFVVALLIGIIWVYIAAKGFYGKKDRNYNITWAKKMFFFSLFALIGLFVIMVLDKILILLIN